MLPILRVLCHYKIPRVVILSCRYILHKSIATVLSLQNYHQASADRNTFASTNGSNLLRSHDLLTIEPGLPGLGIPDEAKGENNRWLSTGRHKQAAKLKSSTFDPVAWLRGSRFAGALAQVSLTGRSLGDVFPWECSRCAVECT